MTWMEIKKKFKNEWVLIETKKVDKNFILQEGKVLFHSKDKTDIYGKLLTLKGKEIYIEYTGKIPDKLAVVLSHEDL